MLEKLKQSSVGALFGVVPPWLLYALIALALMMSGAKLNGMRWAAKYERLQHSYESAQAQAQAVATQQTQANAEQSAQLDKTYYEEFRNAEKYSDYWRARYLTERVPSGSKTANCAETRASAGVGDDTATDAFLSRLCGGEHAVLRRCRWRFGLIAFCQNAGRAGRLGISEPPVRRRALNSERSKR